MVLSRSCMAKHTRDALASFHVQLGELCNRLMIEYYYNVNVLWMYMNVNDLVQPEKDFPIIFLLS